jgi:hypothetical protein
MIKMNTDKHLIIVNHYCRFFRSLIHSLSLSLLGRVSDSSLTVGYKCCCVMICAHLLME